MKKIIVLLIMFGFFNNVLAENEILKRSIQNHVKLKLAAHEYPRLIEFVHELPLTTTGKIIRKDLRENN